MQGVSAELKFSNRRLVAYGEGGEKRLAEKEQKGEDDDEMLQTVAEDFMGALDSSDEEEDRRNAGWFLF